MDRQTQMSTEPSTQDALGECRFREEIHTHEKPSRMHVRQRRDETCTTTPIFGAGVRSAFRVAECFDGYLMLGLGEMRIRKRDLCEEVTYLVTSSMFCS